MCHHVDESADYSSSSDHQRKTFSGAKQRTGINKKLPKEDEIVEHFIEKYDFHFLRSVFVYDPMIAISLAIRSVFLSDQ